MDTLPDLSETAIVSRRTVTNRLSRFLGGREIWALVDQALVSGSNFLTNIVLARMVGIEAFGAFTFAWMAVLFMNGFQNALIVAPMMSVIFISIAPDTLLHFVYGSKYASYGTLLRLYGLLYAMVFVGFPLRAMLQALEFTSPIFLAYAVMSGFSLLFAIPFVRWFGLNGVILGSIATQIIYQGILIAAVIGRVRKLKRAASVNGRAGTLASRLAVPE